MFFEENLLIEQLKSNEIKNIFKEISNLALDQHNVKSVSILITIKQKLDGLPVEDVPIVLDVCQQICARITKLDKQWKRRLLRVMCFIIEYCFKNEYFSHAIKLLEYVPVAEVPIGKEHDLHDLYVYISTLCVDCVNKFCRFSLTYENLPIMEKIIENVVKLEAYRTSDGITTINLANKIISTMYHCCSKEKRDKKFDDYLSSISNIIFRSWTSISDLICDNSSEFLSNIFHIQEITLLYSLKNSSKLYDSNLLADIFLKFDKVNRYVVCAKLPHVLVSSFSNLRIDNSFLPQLKTISKAVAEEEKKVKWKFLIMVAKLLDRILTDFDWNKLSEASKEDCERFCENVLNIVFYVGVELKNVIYDKCPTCHIKCNSTMSTYYATQLFYNVVKFGHVFFQHMTANTRLKFMLIQDRLEECVCLLKRYACAAFSPYLLNTCVLCFRVCFEQDRKSEVTLTILRKSTRLLLKHFYLNNEKPLYREVLGKSLNLMALTYFDLNNFEKCLEPLVLLTILLKNVDIGRNWIYIKGNLPKSTDVDEGCTMVDILNDRFEHLREYCPDLDLEHVDRIELALLELKLYCAHSKGSNSMIKLCRYVMSNETDVLTRGKCLQSCWQIGLPSEDLDLIKCLNSVISKIEEGNWNTLDSKLVLANLYILKYNSTIKTKFIKIKNDLETSTFVSLDEISKEILTSDIKNEEEILESVDRAVLLWTEAFNSSCTDKNFSRCIEENYTLQIIQATFYFYQLHHNISKSIQVAILVYQISDKLGCYESKQKALNFILKNVAQSDLRSFLTENGVEILRNIEDTNAKQELEFDFLLSQSYSLLRSGDFGSGYRILQQLDGKHLENKTKDVLFHVQKNVLHVYYSHLPCYVGIPHSELLMTSIQNLEYLVAVLKSKLKQDLISENLFVLLSALFDLTEWIGNLYLYLRLPREARCYMCQIVSLGCVLNLPLRYVQLVCVLCKLDLVSFKIDNCKTRLAHMCKILGLNENREQKITILLNSDAMMSNFDDLASNINENIKNYLSHTAGCRCTFCCNIFYRYVASECFLIVSEVTKNSIDENINEQLINTFKDKSATLLSNVKIPKFFNLTNLSEFNHNYLQLNDKLSVSSCRYILQYANELYLKNDTVTAGSIVKKLLDFAVSNSYNDLVTEIVEFLCLLPIKSKYIAEEDAKQISARESASSSTILVKSPFRHNNLSPARENIVLVTATPSIVRKKRFFLTAQSEYKTPAKFQIYSSSNTERKPNRKKLHPCGETSPNLHDVDRMYTPFAARNYSGVTGARKKIYKSALEGESRLSDLIGVTPLRKRAIEGKNCAINFEHGQNSDLFSVESKKDMTRVLTGQNDLVATPFKKSSKRGGKIIEKGGLSQEPFFAVGNKNIEDLGVDDRGCDVIVTDDNQSTIETAKTLELSTKNKQAPANKSNVNSQSNLLPELVETCVNFDKLTTNFDEFQTKTDSCERGGDILVGVNNISEQFEQLKISKSSIRSKEMTQTSKIVVNSKKSKLKKSTVEENSSSSSTDCIDGTFQEEERNAHSTRRSKRIELMTASGKSPNLAKVSPVDTLVGKKTANSGSAKKITKADKTSSNAPVKPKRKTKNPFIL